MGVLAEDIGFLLSRASGLVVRASNAALAVDGLRVRQFSVLSLVCEEPDGVSQRDLAEVLGLDPSQVVALVDELDAMGLVTRCASPVDRRTKLVTATAAGRQAWRRAGAHASRAVQVRVESLTSDERNALRRMLSRIIEHDN